MKQGDRVKVISPEYGHVPVGTKGTVDAVRGADIFVAFDSDTQIRACHISRLELIEDLTIAKERVLEAASTSQEAKDLLKSLFPNVFPEPIVMYSPPNEIREYGTFKWVVAVNKKRRDQLRVSPNYIPTIIEEEGYQQIKFTRK